jgi:hypothetical protein
MPEQRHYPGLAAENACILEDTDFAGVRGEQALDKLPPAERSDWQQLWKEVEVLRQWNPFGRKDLSLKSVPFDMRPLFVPTSSSPRAGSIS